MTQKDKTGFSPVETFIENLPKDFLMRNIEWLQEALKNDSVTVIDVRDKDIYQAGHIRGSLSIPVRELPRRYEELLNYRDRDILCYCNGSIVSAYAITFLASRGFSRLYNLSGGFARWKKEGMSVEEIKES